MLMDDRTRDFQSAISLVHHQPTVVHLSLSSILAVSYCLLLPALSPKHALLCFLVYSSETKMEMWYTQLSAIGGPI